jgi:hypothetical protein
VVVVWCGFLPIIIPLQPSCFVLFCVVGCPNIVCHILLNNSIGQEASPGEDVPLSEMKKNSKSKVFLRLKFKRFMIGTLNLYLRIGETVLS